MIDLFLIRKNTTGSVHDVQSRKGLGGNLLDHLVVICKLVLCCTWYRTRNRKEKVRRIRVEILLEMKG